jgi:polyhydroxyalkanoate synthesis regulator phasin
MKELFKRGLLVGLGLAEFTKETLGNAVAELEKRGDVSRGEARKIMDSFSKTARKRRKDLERTIDKALSGMLDKMNIVTTDRLKEMDTRLKSVENKLKKRKTTRR